MGTEPWVRGMSPGKTGMSPVGSLHDGDQLSGVAWEGEPGGGGAGSLCVPEGESHLDTRAEDPVSA